MQNNNVNSNILEKRPSENDSTFLNMNFSDVFLERKNTYLNEFHLYLAHFKAIPNFIHEVNIDCKKANNWFAETYKMDIDQHYYDKLYFDGSAKAELDDIFYFLYDDLIVNFDTHSSIVRFLFNKTELTKVEEISTEIHKFKKRKQKTKPEILLLVQGLSNVMTKPMKISKPKLGIEDNYNDNFKEIHQLILKRLSTKNKTGLVLLHGKPGTGKTSYIRFLISSLHKKVIFLPPNMATSITNPNLISILISNPNSVLVIEDAENIIFEREENSNSLVSTLLNISDGLLADCLNVQIICSFNTDVSKIDSALMRKGRLIAKYEFKELEIEKAQQLSNKLGFITNINKPMTLTSIYNQDEKEFQQLRKSQPIGFQAINNN